MIPSRSLLVLAAAVALANLVACGRSDGAARAAPPTPVPFSLEAPPAPAPGAEAKPAEATAAEPESKPTPAEIAAIEHPRITK